MYFDSFSDFLAMGGYAPYVWSSFGITFLCLLVLAWLSVKRKNQILRQVRDEIERQQRIEAAKTMEDTL